MNDHCRTYTHNNIIKQIHWNPDFSNLQGKRKMIRKIEEFEKSGVKFHCSNEERELLLV